MPRIEDYALIGDLHTAALVGMDGSIDWLCLPHFDSPACFASLLADPEAGRWIIAPDGASRCTRRQYREGTLVLETEWETEDGAVRVIDFMPPRDGVADVVRVVEGVRGTVTMQTELVLRFDYGHVVPWVRRTERGLHAVAGPDSVYLASTVTLHGAHFRTTGEFTVSAGERETFVLTWGPSHESRPRAVDAEKALQRTMDYWEQWTARSQATGAYREAIQRSLITLKALTYMPTGGIVAAATTSLPEQIGGPRNWDYRYCWLRDATWTLQSLMAGGYTDEAAAWRDWLLRAVAGDPADLQIMYSLHGARRLPEAELDWLPGFERSSPVRIGNAAAGQFQLDVWGEVLDGLALTRNTLSDDGDESWDLQIAIMEHLEKIWDQPDNGLWEMRGPRRHFTHSKVMAWVAADRMVKGVEEDGLPGPVDRWRELRDRIHADVLEHGFDAKRNTFVQSYGSDQLDASLLLIPRVGFLPHDDPRVIGTIEAIQRDLTQGGFVLRYQPESSDDGLPGREGIFVACSFWLVEALLGAGRGDEAEKLFCRLLELRNDVGLLSEEWDPDARRQLGNTPQAFSHFALITTAMQLHHGGAHGSNAPVEGHKRRRRPQKDPASTGT
ncbi:Glycoside hydrolase 15-related protein [Sinomonas atrocyanea]|uniref:Trehalase n=1 Tax=Sinomonas atrocyanea TaxID=37927 RepID=A0A127A7K7_9MICC|nr:glycoside hydrolase family 15 protein [Sinomonas atrocyanea]AMM34605.1 Glycoside hydrolase 15-related protein [Sinomonas atrocyanea]GEB63083.1 glucoamylase [Sinomonas atrocyanea]GGG80763.1 glucoamylase [Sinomonas atrocyanea]